MNEHSIWICPFLCLLIVWRSAKALSLTLGSAQVELSARGVNGSVSCWARSTLSTAVSSLHSIMIGDVHQVLIHMLTPQVSEAFRWRLSHTRQTKSAEGEGGGWANSHHHGILVLQTSTTASLCCVCVAMNLSHLLWNTVTTLPFLQSSRMHWWH